MSAPRRREKNLPGSESTVDSRYAHSQRDLGRKPQHTSTQSILTEKFWLAAIFTCILVWVIVDVNYHSVPTHSLSEPHDAQTSDGKYLDTSPNFVEKNARDFLEHMCQLGVRLVGSPANEVLAKDLVIKKVEDIRSRANSVHKIELDIQSPSGCFDIDFLGNFTTCYADVNNILVRISSPTRTEDSSALLINCHYDTAISTPGWFITSF